MGGARLRQDAVAAAPVPLAAVVAVSVPALAALAALLLFVIAEAVGARPFAVAPAGNIAEAAAYGDAARILAFINDGQDPNAAWETRPGLFDARKALHVTALEAAILTRRAEDATLLLHHGAHPAARSEALACLSQAVHMGDVLPPSAFGAPDHSYYTGPLIEGAEALTRCGLPVE